MTTIGQIGEDFVAQWLQQQGWQLLHQRWRSRWGEIDLIAQGKEAKKSSDILAFIEVKTRSQGNWDQGGKLAVGVTKQRKIIQTARLFLSCYPQLENFPCRFDVALVHYQTVGLSSISQQNLSQIDLGKRIEWQ
ncbi:MAG: YraN family protein, partial [Microcystaceae cyanobacterium]